MIETAFRHTKKLVQPIAVLVVLVVFVISTGVAAALTVGNNVTHELPPRGQSMDGASIPSTNNNWNVMILSDHGKVPKIEARMYFTEAGAKTVSFNVFLSENKCYINGLGSPYKASQDFVFIEIQGMTTTKIAGDKVCSATGGLSGKSLPVNVPESAKNEASGRYERDITVRWVNQGDPGAPDDIRQQLSQRDGGNGNQFWFRAQTSGGKIANIRMNDSSENAPNNSFIWRNFPDEWRQVVYPFGRACGESDVTNRKMTLYDADNGVPGVQDSPMQFYAATIDSSGVVTPLTASEYNGVTDSGSDKDREGNLLPSLSGTKDGHPIFTPRYYNNKGGSTTVTIKLLRKQPAKYVLVVEKVHTGNFIYAGLPGDALYGDKDFTCPNPTPPPSLTPHAELNPPGANYEGGDAVTGDTYASNSSMTTGQASWERFFWYEEGTDDTYNGTDALISGSSPTSGSASFPQGNSLIRSTPATIDGTKKRVCVSLRLHSPVAPTQIPPDGDEKATACRDIDRKPYFKVVNGDVNTTKDLVDSLSCSSAGNQISAFWRERPAGTSQGANTQIAAFAGGNVLDFVSAGLRTVTPKWQKGLTFANTSGTFGGTFGAAVGCNNDPDWTRADNTSGANTLSGTASGTKIYDGDLVISGDVDLSSPNNFALASKPYLKVVVRGNIYIQSGVGHIDGIYMATGTIYTCRSGNSPPSITNVLPNCDNRLTVTGSLIANNIKFTRLAGGLRDSNPAETFIYDPLNWLPSPGVDTGTPKFDSYTIMPPIL